MRTTELTSNEIAEIKAIIDSNEGSLGKRVAKAANKFNMSEESIRLAYYRKNSWYYKGKMRAKNKQLIDNKLNICMTLIQKHPDNLQHAFRLAAKETGASAAALSHSYYSNTGSLNKYKQNKFLFRLLGLFSSFKTNMKNNLIKGRSSL